MKDDRTVMGSRAISRPKAAAVVAAAAIAAALGVQAMAAGAGATFTVNTTTDALDAVPGNGICATGGAACSLRAAIQEANARPGADTIVLPAGTYSLGLPPRNQNDITTGDLDITDSVAIAGAGAGATIVDGGAPPAGAPPEMRGIDRVFEVLADGGAVSFTGLTISDGYAAEYGGAIANNSTAVIEVTGSTLTGNVAGKAGGAIDNHLGGAVHVRSSSVSGNFAREAGGAISNNRDGVLTVVDSTVSSNGAAVVGLDEALAGAGAIANNADLDAVGSIVVSDSELSGNRAGGGRSGAAISNDGGGSVMVERTTFTKNVAAADGGAIVNVAGELTVADSGFSDNAATNGGAILASDNAGTGTISRSSFTSNSATGNGGAISSGGMGEVRVTGATFTKNRADDWGGAVHNSDKGAVAISDTAFLENSGLNGGGFGNEGSGLVSIEDTTFTKNLAVATAVLTEGEGGGMHSNSGGEVVIAGSAFTENEALSGGGLSNEGGGQMTVTGTRFASNTADEQGGGVLIQSGAARLVDVDVISNVAGSPLEGGGGIAYAGDKAIGVGETAAIKDSRIRNNSSPGPGGGIDSRGDGPLSITTTSITGNSAAMGGAIHHVGDAPLEVVRSTLSGNLAENGGGVFSDGDGEALVENSTVSGNRAGMFGGGLLVSSRVTVRSSTVAANSAASGGGIDNGGGDLIGDGSAFFANTIVAGSPTGGNCAGTVTSRGGNVDSGDTCQFRELTDQPGTDPRLGPLASNGGPTQTHALLEGSPAQERAACTEVDPCPPLDQRGIERPLFVGVDAGAYESALPPAGGGGQQCSGRIERPVPVAFDSWISQSSPANNFGNDATLKVESKAAANQRALLHFALPAVPPGCRVVGARLRLYASSSTEGRTLEALRVASPWTELGVTWGNQPPATGAAATAVSGLGAVEWDVLGQTLEMYARGNHGFLVRDGSESGLGAQALHSREKGDDRPPELVLVFDDPDNPPPPGSCPTTPSLVSADRDSWVSQSSPSNTFGTDSTLKVKSQQGANARALVRFPLPGLPPGCTGVASAVMRLEAASAKLGRVLEARRIAGSWTENGVTWAGRPGTAGAAATTPSVDGPLEWDVTDQVMAMYGSGNHGFEIRDGDEDGVGDEQTLNSRDKIGDGPPQLLLVFDDSTPDTTIDTGPPALGDSTEAAFTFSSSHEDATFECSLDAGAFVPCTSPHVVRGLTEGDHGLEVRATRGAGAFDPTPARYDWTVAIPPDTTVDGPPSSGAGASARLTFASDDPAASFQCSLDAAPFAACASPVEYAHLPDGERAFRVRAVDAHGNADPSPAVHRWTVAVPPTTRIDSAPPALSNSASAAFAFSADEDATFECRLDGGAWGACSEYTGLADGVHTFDVRATDRAGNVGDAASSTWTIDTAAPEVTITPGPPDPTPSTSAELTVAAVEPDATIECRLDGGAWGTCAPLTGLADGRHTFEARATDRAGNVGGAASYSWTVDTVAPAARIDRAPPDPSSDRSPAFEFSAGEDATFECRLDATSWGPCSPVAELADGRHTFEVRATDRAGNQGAAASHSWTMDTVAPEASISSRPADPTNVTSASFTLGAGEPDATVECRLDGGAWGACARVDGLADGRHTFEARATDRAGNVGPVASYSWTVDSVAPTVTITAAPPDPSDSAAATFAFTAGEAASFECRLDGADWATCDSPLSYSDLPDGRHAFQVRASDQVGNRGAVAEYVWTIGLARDVTPPETSITDRPAALTSSTSASFSFSADEASSFECRLDTGDWATCESPQGYSGLADGEHTFRVRATDVAGNLGAAASSTWTVDTVAPTVTISGSPSNPSNSAAATFAFSAAEASTFECRLDTGDWVACESPKELVGLGDGEHTFRVRATDVTGNMGAAASYTWTVDTRSPEARIASGPADRTAETSASFVFDADEDAGFECRLDAADWASCESPQEYAGLADGEHTFRVRATDRAGNLGAAASRVWLVDTVAPRVTISAAPSDPSDSAAASFVFGADEAASFECRLDAGDWVACESPREYSNLADGEHTFRVRATDVAGNVGAAASYTWTVDTVAPAVTISAAPSNPSDSAAARFSFSADEAASFECRLDSGDWTGCESPKDLVGLSDGEHAFQVRATDGAGNLGAPASYAWTVDTTAPEARIASGPADRTAETSASFVFDADGAASFECRLDSGDWAACESPEVYSGLADGEHTFRVRATDVAGNQGAAASYTWTVDTQAPEVGVVSGPAARTTATSASFVFVAREAAAFECRLDAGDWAACESPQEYGGLARGEHVFEVRATDVTGNRGAAVAYTWMIEAPGDDTPPSTSIADGPDELSGSASASFVFGADEAATFDCRLDDGDWAACESPQSYAGLADGEHTFQVRATDTAGNRDTSPASSTWTVDTTAPQTTIDAGPSDLTSSARAELAFSASESGAAFECSLDGAAFAPCGSPSIYTGLARGQHRFSVRATDPAGNTDPTPADHEWTISAPPSCGPPVTAGAGADAWLDENSASTNKGSDSILKVQSKGPRDNFRALLRFNLPPLPPGCVVESATLRLYAASARTGRTLQAVRLAAPWSESQVTWANQPRGVGNAATTESGPGWRTWAVTSQVQAMYADANHGLLVRDAFEGHDAEQQFHSREKGEQAPQLVLRFAEGSSSLAAPDAGQAPGVSTFAARATRTGRMRVPPASFLAYRFACGQPCSGTVTGRVTVARGRRVAVKLRPATFRAGSGARARARVSLPAKAMRLIHKRKRARLQLMTVLRSDGSSARLPATIRIDAGQ